MKNKTKGKEKAASRRGGAGLVLKRLWGSFRHHMGLKILSLVFSIILCNIIMTQSNPVRRTTLYDVPVVLTGLDDLWKNDLILSAESQAKLTKISVTLGVRMQELSRVTTDKVTAKADLSSITQAGNHEVAISVSSVLGTVYGQNPEKVQVTVEPLASKTVPVSAQSQGTPAEGYTVSSVGLSPNVITVDGPKSLVDQVYKAQVQVDVNQINKSTSGSQSFILVDEAGNGISSQGLTLSTSGVITTLDVKKTMTLPVNAAMTVTGADRLPVGYELVEVKAVPDKVQVTGSESALSGLVELTTGALDIADVIGSKTFTVNLKPVSGVTMEVSQVEVVVRVEPVSVTRTIAEVPVKVVNLAEGFKPVGEGSTLDPATVDVTVTGPEAVVSKLSIQDIDLTVDAAGMSAGSHQLQVAVKLEAADQGTIEQGNILLSTAQVTLTLTDAP
jgi:YbbR domain-containing protein